MIRLTSDSPTCWSGPAVCSTLCKVPGDVLTVINPVWSVWPPPLGNRTGKQHTSLSWPLQAIDTMQLAWRKPSSVLRVIGNELNYETVEIFIVVEKPMADLLICLWGNIIEIQHPHEEQCYYTGIKICRKDFVSSFWKMNREVCLDYMKQPLASSKAGSKTADFQIFFPILFFRGISVSCRLWMRIQRPKLYIVNGPEKIV